VLQHLQRIQAIGHVDESAPEIRDRDYLGAIFVEQRSRNVSDAAESLNGTRGILYCDALALQASRIT
jgi:hypothetical protein